MTIVHQFSSFLFPSPWRLVVLFMTSSVRCPLIFPFLRPFLVPSPFIIHSKSSIHPYHHHLPFPTIKILYPPLFHIHVLSLSSYFPFLAHTTVQYIPVWSLLSSFPCPCPLPSWSIPSLHLSLLCLQLFPFCILSLSSSFSCSFPFSALFPIL